MKYTTFTFKRSCNIDGHTNNLQCCNAQKGIIPIHTENGEAFKKLELKCPILHLKDGEILSV